MNDKTENITDNAAPADKNGNGDTGGIAPAGEKSAGKAGPTFRMENILIKNLSLEMPSKVVTPDFGEKPTMKIELRTSTRRLSRENYYEVVLEANCRLQNGEETQLLVEVAQAGVVLVENAPPQLRERILNIHAPEMLYPYISQTASDLLMRAGAPRLFLPPFNFRAVYEQKLRTAEKKIAEEKNSGDKPEKVS